MMTFLSRLDTPVVIALAILAAVVAGFVLFRFTFSVEGKKGKRIKSIISRHRGELSASQAAQMNRPSAIRQKKLSLKEQLAQKLLGTLKIQNLVFSQDLRDSLAQAGLRGRTAANVYVASRIIGIVLGFFLTLTFVGLMKKFPYPDFVRFLIAFAGAGIGFYLPRILLTNRAQKRQQDMTENFPDALDLLVICVESGLSVEMAFSRVTEEILESSPILAQELGLTSAELAYLGDRRQAYENFAKRTGMESAKALATTLIQSEQYGTPVGKALKVLAQEKRDERLNAAEKKAAALPAKLTVPMIIFFLPVLFIVVIGPAALSFGK